MITKPIFTVCTPTYNRVKLLPRVYECLKQQTFRDFEWLIVDDGSWDQTKALVESWQIEATMPIRYIWKENGGKHSAHNLCVKEAHADLFVMVDSDDWMVPNALEVMLEEWRSIPNQQNYSGVCCLFQYPDGAVVGDRFPRDRMDSNAIDLRYNLNVWGDKMGLIRMDILRQFPFPDDLGRHLIPESLVWNRISQAYHMRCINRIAGVKEYQSDGLTNFAALHSFHNPTANYLLRLELLNGRVPIRFPKAARVAISLAKCCVMAKKSPFAVKPWIYRWMTVGALPMGAVLAMRDAFQAKRARAATPAPGQRKDGVRIV
jgi:glycosyltransferase involved in cell wall biosynthesis